MKIKSKPGPLMAPLPVVMVSLGTMDDSNIITIAWTGIINTNPPMTYISVQKSRYSHDIILERGEFVINLTTTDLVRAADFCGVKSGRNVDKFARLSLTREEGDATSAPMIAESPVNLECKVTEVREFPTHDMIIAEIVSVHIDDRYVDASGAYYYGKMDLAAYNHGKYYKLGREELGFFGFSVMKPKTAKKRRISKHAPQNKKSAH